MSTMRTASRRGADRRMTCIEAAQGKGNALVREDPPRCALWDGECGKTTCFRRPRVSDTLARRGLCLEATLDVRLKTRGCNALFEGRVSHIHRSIASSFRRFLPFLLSEVLVEYTLCLPTAYVCKLESNLTIAYLVGTCSATATSIRRAPLKPSIALCYPSFTAAALWVLANKGLSIARHVGTPLATIAGSGPEWKQRGAE
ncbi:hypothetical protein F5B21DRAFT_191091 [Xylaria acuta]|nr:hypothetical protein F5B21DRAFT_191091 [Xylaria acuta]